MIALLMSLLIWLAIQTAGAEEPAVDRRAVETLFSQVYPNWILHCDTPGVVDVRVRIDLRIDANGRIVSGATLVDPSDTPAYRTVALSALAALRAAEPFDVPRGFRGGAFRPVFNPGKACRRS